MHLGEFLHHVFSTAGHNLQGNTWDIVHPIRARENIQVAQAYNQERQSQQAVKLSPAQKAAIQPMHFPSPGVDAATQQAHQIYLQQQPIRSQLPIHVAPSFDLQVQQPHNTYQRTSNPQASTGTAGTIQGSSRNPQRTQNIHVFQHPQQIPVQHLNTLYRNMFGDY